MLRLLAIRSLIFPFLRLVWRLIRDRRVSVFTKIIPLLALIYLISPYDLVGDRIPVLGQFDDLIVITVLLLLFIAASPAHVVADLTIGKKLRDLQNQKNGDSEGKTVDTEIRYIDDEDDESDGDAKKEDEDENGDSGKPRS
jgi:uncharacterized membrane protein YkvA (DUF1232 family)